MKYMKNINKNIKKKNLKRITLIIIALVALLVVASCEQNKPAENSMSDDTVVGENRVGSSLAGQAITLYKAQGCACCEGHIAVLKDEGANVEVIEMPSVASIKEQYNIPREVQSCHTAIIGDYFVEGHMPIEAIEKLLEEQPDIDGIALPGMPSGAAGMHGAKQGTWTIYAVKDGVATVFMEI